MDLAWPSLYLGFSSSLAVSVLFVSSFMDGTLFQELAGAAGCPCHGDWLGQGPSRGTGRVQCPQTDGQGTPASVDGQQNGVTSHT